MYLYRICMEISLNEPACRSPSSPIVLKIGHSRFETRLNMVDEKDFKQHFLNMENFQDRRTDGQKVGTIAAFFLYFIQENAQLFGCTDNEFLKILTPLFRRFEGFEIKLFWLSLFLTQCFPQIRLIFSENSNTISDFDQNFRKCFSYP